MGQSKLKFGTPVHVTWVDASGDSGWGQLEELPKKLIHISQIGYVLKMDKEALHLAEGLCKCESNCGKFLGHAMIPRGCLKKVRVIKL